MPATVVVKECTGATPTTTTVTSLAFCTQETTDPGTSYPIPIPPSGTSYSYTKVVFINANTTPDGTINNVKFYTDGTNSMGTGVGLLAGTSASYTRPTGTVGVAGTPSSIADTNAFSYAVGSPLSAGGSLNNPSTGKISDYVYLQMTVGSTASGGGTTNENGTFAWDET